MNSNQTSKEVGSNLKNREIKDKYPKPHKKTSPCQARKVADRFHNYFGGIDL